LTCGLDFWPRLIQFSDNSVQRTGHIRTRIAIWNGVHIEPINALSVGFDRIAKGDHGSTESVCVKTV
jgi:hypothetical protein